MIFRRRNEQEPQNMRYIKKTDGTVRKMYLQSAKDGIAYMQATPEPNPNRPLYRFFENTVYLSENDAKFGILSIQLLD